jgi:hypothetical protein
MTIRPAALKRPQPAVGSLLARRGRWRLRQHSIQVRLNRHEAFGLVVHVVGCGRLHIRNRLAEHRIEIAGIQRQSAFEETARGRCRRDASKTVGYVEIASSRERFDQRGVVVLKDRMNLIGHFAVGVRSH